MGATVASARPPRTSRLITPHTSGSVASNRKGLMATRTVSELANWDGRLDQHRQNVKRRRSSNNIAYDPHHTPLNFENSQHLARLSGQKRAEQPFFRSNSVVRASLGLSVLVSCSLQTTPTYSVTPCQTHPQTRGLPVAPIPLQHSPMIRFITIPFPSWQVPPLFQPINSSSRSTQHAPPRPALPPSQFTTAPLSSQHSPNSSVHASRTNKSRPPSPAHTTLLRPMSTMESDVIDLTIEDTEDELSVSDMMVSFWLPDQHPG